MPSAPPKIGERATAKRREPTRTSESFDWYESARIVLAAGTAFQEVVTFSGRPESIILDTTAVGVDFRLRHRGESAGSVIRIEGIATRVLDVSAEIVEARDPAGVGGQGVTATGRFMSRNIDVRAHRAGPSRERPLGLAEDLSTQIATSD